MGDARPLYKTDELARAHERIARLEARDRARAEFLAAVKDDLAITQRMLERETAARLQAEKEKNQFHALLIQERIRKVPDR